MKADAMIESKFLKKEDINGDIGNLVTIARLEQLNVAMQDKDEELKWCAHFREFSKPMVLNATNIQLATKAIGSDETDDWIGKKIVLYVDDSIAFGGKLVGGIRIRKPRGAAAPRPAPQVIESEDPRQDPRPYGPTNLPPVRNAKDAFGDFQDDAPPF